MRNGSERVVTSAREHIYDLRSLENYTHIDEMGRDQGVNGKNLAFIKYSLLKCKIFCITI